MLVVPIVELLFLPALAGLKKIDVKFLFCLEAVISTITSCFAAVLLSSLIFKWLSVEFSVLPILMMLVLSSFNSLSRLGRFRETDRFSIELSYTIGGTIGFILGAMYFVYAVPLRVVVCIAAVPVLILIYCLLTSRQKSFPFWKLASDIPDQAYDWFLNDPCWVVLDPPSGRSEKPDLNQYNGGFFIFVRSLGRKIFVYGRFDLIEDSQRRFIAQYGDYFKKS
jgi:hypothetical protein